MARKNRVVRWTGKFGPKGRGLRQAGFLFTILVLAPLIWADRTELKPGWNMFSPQQDIELGQQASIEAEKQIVLMNDSQVDNYLNNLGQRLSAQAPGYKFPYTYKAVNDRAINAFALPGGHIYINRGVIETADDEAQLAGVMAHETSHVALRHGTNQASKASAAQLPLSILGGVLGSNSILAALAQLGAGFTMNSILLKYSRTDESQADILGTQILYDSGYDPRAMAQFFEKLQAQSKGKNTIEFFSDHPNPDHRLERVDQEIDNLGGSPRGAKTDSQQFQNIKRYVLSRPGPPSKVGAQSSQANTGSSTRPGSASTGLRILSANYGAKDRFVDVSQLLQSQVQNNLLDLKVTNASMGGDPIVGEEKTLRIRYEWAGRTHEMVVQENQRLTIPTAQEQTETPAISSTRTRNSTTGLRILAASYGAKDRFVDVRQLLESRQQNDQLNLQVTNASMGGDPIVGEEKTLRIRYEWAGRTHDVVVKEGQQVSIPTTQERTEAPTSSGTPAELPSNRVKSFENSVLRLEYPDNWQTYGQGDAVTIAPRGGLVEVGNGNQALAYGVLINIYVPRVDNANRQKTQPERYAQASGMSLQAATDRLVQELRLTNQKIQIIRNPENFKVDGQPALSTYFSNDSPLGGRETDRLVTLECPDGLLFIVFTAPARDFQSYDKTFQQVLTSVRMQSGSTSSYNRARTIQSTRRSPGRMTWRGQVDADIELTIQDNRVRIIERSGAPTVIEQVNFSSPLPRAVVTVSVNKLKGRGNVSVIAQPNQSNSFTAIIKIVDDEGGADDYQIEVDWR